MTNKTLLVMAGGTGGHIYPALSVADYLSDIGWNIVWLGTKQGLEKKIIPEAGYEIEWLDIKGVRGKNFKQLVFAPYNIIISCVQALKILLKVKPAAVLGMGGFVTMPGGLMAALLCKPLIIHEQNAVAGTANRFLKIFANKVLFSFENTFKKSKKYILTGNPVRKEIVQSAKCKSEDEKNINLLVLGGSLGARTLNEFVPQALVHVLDGIEKKINIIHQCGANNLDETIKKYTDMGVDARVVPYIKDMHEVYEWADLAICRAGAMTVAELSTSAVPAVFIPYPYAIDDHQTLNAQVLEKVGGAEIISENKISVGLLADVLDSIISDELKLSVMQENVLKVAKPNAAAEVAEICVQESCS